MVEGDFPLNARETYWCTGTNIVLRSIITPLPLEVQLSRAASQIADKVLGRTPPPPLIVPGWREPKVGELLTTVLPSTDPNQLLPGFHKVPWLAFCSGPFLQSNGRHVPVPIGIDQQNYLDSTSVFSDGLGLPKQMELRTPNNHLLSKYTVEEATNFLGWTFPTRFKFVEYRPDSNGILQDDLQAEGKVISIRKAAAPEVPDDVLKAIKK